MQNSASSRRLVSFPRSIIAFICATQVVYSNGDSCCVVSLVFLSSLASLHVCNEMLKLVICTSRSVMFWIFAVIFFNRERVVTRLYQEHLPTISLASLTSVFSFSNHFSTCLKSDCPSSWRSQFAQRQAPCLQAGSAVSRALFYTSIPTDTSFGVV